MPGTPNYYAVAFPTYQRAMRNILSITQSNPSIITTTLDGTTPGNHQYATGLIVRLIIPHGFGMTQLDKQQCTITVTSDTTFTIPLDTTLFDAFVVPAYNPGHFGTPAQVVPIGEVNELLTMATKNVLPYP